MTRRNLYRIMYRVIFWALIPLWFIACTGTYPVQESTTVGPVTQATEPPVIILPTDSSTTGKLEDTYLRSVELSKVYLAALPSDYQTMVLPVEMVDKLESNTATLVNLPDPDTLSKYNTVMFEKSTELYASPEVLQANYNLINTAVLLKDDTTYIAVPAAKPEIYRFEADGPGVKAGVMYNDRSIYSQIAGREAFGDEFAEVWLFDDRAEVRIINSGAVTILKVGEGFYWQENVEPVEVPKMFFIENGCWLCWGGDGRCGCLICTK